MGRVSEQMDRQKKAVQPNYRVRYVVRGHFMGANYGPYPGDPGLIIPKLLNLGKDEQLLRLGYLEEYKGKDSFECGVCGNKFSEMKYRDTHHRKRHGPRRGPIIKNLEDLTDEQRQKLFNEVSSEYWTSPGGLRTGDPEDSEILAEERQHDARAPLYMDKTAASKK